MAIPSPRDRLVPQRSSDRAAGLDTTSRQLRIVRPVSKTQMLVIGDNCQLAHVVTFVDPQAPGSQTVGIQAFHKTGQKQLLQQPAGAGGVTALGFTTETTEVAQPLVVAQDPAVMFAAETAEILLIGWNFSEDPVDTFTAVLPGTDDEPDVLIALDPFVTITVPPVFVPIPSVEGLNDLADDATVVKLTIEVDADHPTGLAETADPLAFLHWRVTKS